MTAISCAKAGAGNGKRPVMVVCWESARLPLARRPGFGVRAGRCVLVALFLLAATWAAPGQADVYQAITGDWSVYWNRPDQHRSVISGHELDIRDALLERIDALGAGDLFLLAAAKFAGHANAGEALKAMDRALGRGATVKVIVDDSVDTTFRFARVSLNSLAQDYPNMTLVKSPRDVPGRMHHKAAVFDYASSMPGKTTVWSASADLHVGGFNHMWDIAVRFDDNRALFDSFYGEFNELLAGRFRNDPDKSHAFNRDFSLIGQSSLSHVRFAPHLDATVPEGDNAGSEMIAAIAAAEHSLVFAVPIFTNTDILEAILERADSGVKVYGVLSVRDTTEGKESAPILDSLGAHPNIMMLTADRIAGGELDPDDGSSLVHVKYMLIDPGTPQAVVVHGSANWTTANLFGTRQQEEYFLFLRHPDMAEAFLAQFDTLTAGRRPPLPVPEPAFAVSVAILSTLLIRRRVPGPRESR